VFDAVSNKEVTQVVKTLVRQRARHLVLFLVIVITTLRRRVSKVEVASHGSARLTAVYAAFSSSYRFLSAAALASYGVFSLGLRFFQASPSILPTSPGTVLALVSTTFKRRMIHTEFDAGVFLADLVAAVVGEEHVSRKTTLGRVGIWVASQYDHVSKQGH